MTTTPDHDPLTPADGTPSGPGGDAGRVDEVHAALRRWARGSYPLEAAAELLIRAHGGRFAHPGRSWIDYDDPAENALTTGPGRADGWSAWLDLDELTDAATAGPYSGGECRLLLLAASLAGGPPVPLDEALPGLDRDHVALVLAAVAHAAGTHQHPALVVGVDEHGARIPRRTGYLPPLYPWPDTTAGDAGDQGDAGAQLDEAAR